MGFLASLLNRLRGKAKKKDDKPSKSEFAEIVMATLRSIGDTRTPSYNEEEFRIQFTKDGKPQGVMNLSNLYTEYCRCEEPDRTTLLKRTAVGFAKPMDLPDEFDDARPDILPSLRTRTMGEILRLDSLISGETSATLLPSVPLTDHLVICFVYDLPHTMQFITDETIEKWGVSIYEVLEVAMQNLAERSFTLCSLDEKVFIVETGDAYDATRLLLKDQIRQLPVKGKPIAMPVARDTLLISGEDDPEGVGIMLAIAEAKAENARPICSIPLILEDDDWQEWPIPGSHPEFTKLDELKYRYWYGEYDEQKKLLERRNEQTNTDVFVATYSVLERNGKLLSWCVWAKGCATWMPRTDYVGLCDSDSEAASRFVPWHEIEAQVGHMLTPLDYFPPRWFVDEFPSDEQIAEMKPEDWRS